jgi:hypothetical protein
MTKPEQPTEQKSNINPEILQDMLESAKNAAEKGQSQFFTPLDLARQLVTAMPKSPYHGRGPQLRRRRARAGVCNERHLCPARQRH